MDRVAPKVSKIMKNDNISQTELSYIGSKDAESQCEGRKTVTVEAIGRKNGHMTT